MKRSMTPASRCALLIAAVVVVPGAPAAASASHCPPAHAHVLRASRNAVVVSRQPAEEGVLFFGCARATNRTYSLGHALEGYGGGIAGGGSGITHLVLAGTMVGFEERSFTRSEQAFHGVFQVRVRDLRNGRTLHVVPTGTLKEPIEGDVGAGPITTLVVKPNGAVAWIVHATLGGGGGVYEVHAVDKAGPRILAEGTDIAPKSLRLQGARLTWRQGGKTMRASLD